MSVGLSDHFTYRKLLKFTFPAIVMMVFTSIYGVIDGFFVTNFAGKTALAAINFVYPVLNILATFGYMFGVGGSALVAKTLGEKKSEKAQRLFSLFVYISFLLGVVFSVVGFFLLKPFMQALGADGEMLSLAIRYGNILLVSMPFWNLQFLFQIFFVTAEKPKLGLYTTLIAGFANIFLDALFVGLFSWGIKGAAIATAISQILGGGIPLFYFSFKNTSLLQLGKTKFDKKAVFRATTNGASELVSGISGSFVGILYNTQLIRYAGEDGVAAYGIMMYVCFVFIGIFFGYANGVSPVISYHYGAKNHEELKSLLKKSVVLTITASVSMLVLSEILSKPLCILFAGYDATFYNLTLHGFRIYALSFLFSGTAVFGSAFFTALNNGLVSATISFARTIVFQVLCVLLCPLVWEIDGVWSSVVFAEALSVLVAVSFIIGMRKKYDYM